MRDRTCLKCLIYEVYNIADGTQFWVVEGPEEWHDEKGPSGIDGIGDNVEYRRAMVVGVVY